ncbi:hypothetical protein ACFQPA_14725 [Halomarina halobia]|uniref:Uncharacterized protein n=1 Tax=Halomarina halobia TaxID=3033386 RepID=A0ABD6A7V2_9EURY|nr:hypothetical protein [Halomarina sp. PSR21]
MSERTRWAVRCTVCDFRGRAPTRALANRLAEIHQSASGHDVDVARDRGH